jgi:hypothetical protein
VHPETAGEQAVSDGNVHAHARSNAACAKRARYQFGPSVDIVLRLADDGRLAGRAGGGVNARTALLGNGQHPKGIVVAQILLGGEREFLKGLRAA